MKVGKLEVIRPFYVYMLLCDNGSYYTGYTVDPQRRVIAHMSGKGAKYTRAHKPVEIAYIEELNSKSEAMKRECAIKALSHAEKKAMADKWSFSRIARNLGSL